MAEATRKYNTLKSDMQASKEQYGNVKNRKAISFFPKINVPARKMQDIKLAFSEFYLSLILLQNYQNLNFTGFRKILKKHDKVILFNKFTHLHMSYLIVYITLFMILHFISYIKK